MKIYFVYKDENGKVKAASADQVRKSPGFRFVYTEARSAREAIKKARKIL